jgi:malonyl-CoA/methylmalonyl-CoA synthetase
MTDGASIFAAIDNAVGGQLDSPFVIHPDGACVTYRDMFARTAQYGNLLIAQGVRPGDRVLVKAEKSIEIILLYLACVRAGLVFLPVNPAFKDEETAHIVRDAEPAVIVCIEDEAGLMRTLSPTCRAIFTLDGDAGFSADAARYPATFETVDVEPDGLAVILYTSGTTGRPKGAMLTHGNIVSNGLSLSRYWQFSAKDVLLHCLPLFHSHGLFVSLSCSLLSGSAVLFCNKFDLDQVFDLLPRCTVFMGVPTMYVRMANSEKLDRERCKSIRLFASGSAALLPQTFERFRTCAGASIVERYGMTETGINSSNPMVGECRAGSVGLPLPGISIRIAGVDGRELAPGETGAVQIRGRHVFRGYWRRPEQSAEVLKDGWFTTGDLGRIDAAGYLCLVGREKDLIISGGYNVYPLEVEGVIDRLNSVLESTVVGLPHPDYGEAVTAIIVERLSARDEVRSSEATIIRHVKDHLAGYKVPKKVVFLDSLPRNALGKVEKTTLRQRFSSLYDVEPSRDVVQGAAAP